MGEGYGGGIGREEGSGHDEKKGDGEHGGGWRFLFFFVLIFNEKKKKIFFDQVVVSRAMNGMWEKILYCYFCRMGEILNKKIFFI